MASLSDGSAGAPSGVAQFANLLTGYAVRPDWKVAGVDYYVGTPSGTVLKDPSTISMAGVSINKSTHIVTVSSSNVTLSGYDFGLSGGWQVDVTNNANNVTIQNSHFAVGTNNLMPIQAYYGGSINVLNNTFDGGASHGSSVNAMIFAGAGANVQYNQFTNFPNDGIDITRDGNFVIHNNVFDNMGAGDFHTDAIQTYFSAISSLSIEFNTMYEPPNMSNGGINSFARIGDQQGNVVHNPVAAYNTIIMASTHAETSNVFQWDSQGDATLANPQIHDNFIDPKGVQYSVVAPALQNTAGVVNPVTYNNIDLTTGKPLLSGPYNSQTSGIPGKAPTAPAITSESAAGSTQVKLAGTAGANTTVDIYDQGQLLGSVKASSAGAWSYTTAQLAVGDHSLAARATDSMSNTSALSNAWSVSATSSGTTSGGSSPGGGTSGGGTGSAPGAPVIASYSNDTGVVGDGITSDNTLQLKGTAAANSVVKVYDGANQIGQATANASGGWEYITTVLTNATHTLKATATSAGGQTSTPSAILTVTVDNAAPAAPIVTSDSVVNTNHVLLSGTGEANSSIKVYDGTTLVGSATTSANGSWSVTTNTLSTGAHVLKATATDAAGNVSGMSQGVDPVIGGGTSTPPPAVPQIVSVSTDSGVANDHITNDATLALAGVAQANSTVKVFDGSNLVGEAHVNGSGNWTLTTSTLNDGAHKFTATDTDTSGHVSVASTAFSVTIDTHAPSAPTMSVYSQGGTAVSGSTNLDDLVVKGAAEASSKVAVFDGGKQIGITTANSAGTWSYDTGHLDNGSHSFTAMATDVAGNNSASSAAKGVTVQGAAAPLEFTGLFANSHHGATIKGTADAYSLIKLYDGDNALGTIKADADGDWTFRTSSLSNTTHTFKAQEIDSSGHVVAATSGAAILGSSWANTLVSTTGNDIFIGNGHPDTFTFTPNFGQDVIKDFAASGRGHDTIDFSKSVFSDFASVLNHASQVGPDVVIAHGDDSLTLKNTKIGALKGYDFHFA